MRNILFFALVLLYATGYGQKVRPGTVPTQADGWTMTASIDGKPFKATSVGQPGRYGRIIGYEEGSIIGMPYWKARMFVGGKVTFKENNAVDLTIMNDHNLWGAIPVKWRSRRSAEDGRKENFTLPPPVPRRPGKSKLPTDFSGFRFSSCKNALF